MALQPSTAARAAQFMQQCRARRQLPYLSHNHTHTRPVSSSHLAPSNFSKQTRKRDTEISYPRFPPQAIHNLPPRPNTSTSTSQLSVPIPPGFFSFFKHRILSIPPPAIPLNKAPPFNILNNPWRAKKSWPPDFDAMHPRQQFAFEKTFRRRLVLKTNSNRYNWNRYIRLLQQSLIIVTVVYFVFIADPYKKDGGGTPVDGFRAWFFGQVEKFEHLPEGLREGAGELSEYYQKNWKKAPWETEQDGESVREGGIDGEGGKEVV